MLWGAIRFVDKFVVPQLRGVLLESCVGKRNTSTASRAANAAIQGVLKGALRMPMMVQAMVLGGIHHLSNGSLWSLEFDFTVTDWALKNLDSVMPSGSPKSRLRSLWQPYKDLRHPCLAAFQNTRAR